MPQNAAFRTTITFPACFAEKTDAAPALFAKKAKIADGNCVYHSMLFVFCPYLALISINGQGICKFCADIRKINHSFSFARCALSNRLQFCAVLNKKKINSMILRLLPIAADGNFNRKAVFDLQKQIKHFFCTLMVIAVLTFPFDCIRFFVFAVIAYSTETVFVCTVLLIWI